MKSTPWAIALGLVLGGIFGNLTDRIFRSPGGLQGEVVDWIQIPNWPVFNIADSCVSCGVVLLLIFNLYIPTFEEIKTGKPIEPKIEEKLDRDEVIED